MWGFLSTRNTKQDRSLTAYFMELKKTYEKLNTLLPLNPDVKFQQAQREHMAIMSFLAGLSLEFDTTKSHILSSYEISLVEDTFS